MAKLIVVCGATGQLGGSVARRMLKEGWKVRAITRNVDGHAAKALRDQGAEVMAANYDEDASLTKAFEGANAIFAVTNFWEYFLELGSEGAGQKEYEQCLAIASVAQKTAGLEHLIIHTLPSGEKLAGKQYICPHWDYKDRAADKIKESMPDLAKKTTFLWVAWFVSNLWLMNAIKPLEIPGTYGSWVMIGPCKPKTIMHITDIEHNVGSFVSAILLRPEVSLPAKYAFVFTDSIEYQDVLKPWSQVTGKRGTFIDCSKAQAESMFGPFASEICSQFDLNEVAPDWGKAHSGEVIGAKELGIPADDLLDLRQSLEVNKDKLLY